MYDTWANLGFLMLTSLVAVVIAIYTLKRIKSEEAKYTSYLLFASAIWSFFRAIENRLRKRKKAPLLP